MSELSKKKSVRVGHSGSAIKMIGKVETLMAEYSPDPAVLSQLKVSLSEKLKVLKQLDNEILSMVEEEDETDEITRSDQLKEGMYAAIVKVEH